MTRMRIYRWVIFAAGLAGILQTRGVAAEEKQPFVYDDHGRRDPFWWLVGPDGTILNYETDFLITDLALEGIMAGDNGANFAIINGRVLKKNDSIGQFVVEEIGENWIVLSQGKKKFELKLKKED